MMNCKHILELEITCKCGHVFCGSCATDNFFNVDTYLWAYACPKCGNIEQTDHVGVCYESMYVDDMMMINK
jgi:hypothetical protein